MKLPVDRHHLVTDNLRLVHKIAGKVARNNRDAALEYDDIYAAGCEGLIYAATKFNDSKGCTFSTFAYQCISGYISKQFNRFLPISVPANVKITANAIVKNNMIGATAGEIAERFDCTVQWASNALHSLSISSVSAQQLLKAGEDETMELFIRTDDDETELLVSEFLGSLNEKHRNVAKGLMRGETLREMGDREGVTYQGIGLRANAVRQRWLKYEAAL